MLEKAAPSVHLTRPLFFLSHRQKRNFGVKIQSKMSRPTSSKHSSSPFYRLSYFSQKNDGEKTPSFLTAIIKKHAIILNKAMTR